jgi:hypothetical protein
MEDLIKIIGGAVVISFAVIIIPLISTIMGYCCGWMVGIFFEETVANVMLALGSPKVAMTEIGAACGFVGGFFRSTSTSNS